MKNLIIFFSIIFTSTAFAGNLFFEIDSVKAKSLQTAIKEFKAFEEVRAFEYGSPYLTLLKMKVREGGSVEQAIRHYIWKTWSGGHSIPEEVTSNLIDKDQLYSKARSLFAESDYFEPEVPFATYSEIKEKFLTSLTAMKRFSSMKFYYLGHGNEFGGCHAIVVVDSYDYKKIGKDRFSEVAMFNDCLHLYD